MSIERTVVNFFQDNHLNVKREWLGSCLEYFIASNPQAKFQEVRDFALEQWKLGNLREIGEPTLPDTNLKAVRVTELTGYFAVQIEKFWDKANSSYNQYKSLKGKLDDNQTPEENENEADVTEWGKGPSVGETKRSLKPRKLLMEICDGRVELKALEWKPIQELSGMVYPGAKMVIKGPVVCRNGILMLGPEHVKLYGGEVDSIIFSNAMENLLADSLGYPTNNDPYSDKKSTLPPPRKPQPPSSRNQWQPKQQSAPSQMQYQNQQNKVPPQRQQILPTNLNVPRPNNMVPKANNQQRPAPAASTNIFNNPFNTARESSMFSRPPCNQAPALVENQNQADIDDFDDFELSVEDLQAIESVERSQPSRSSLKRQSPSPIDDHFEDYALMELERLEEEEGRAAKRPLLEPTRKVQPPAVVRVPPIRQQVRVNPILEKLETSRDKRPSLGNFLSKAKNKLPIQPIQKLKIQRKPFLYLNQLSTMKRKRATIKATVISILRKLSTSNRQWSLLAKITDSTGFLDVELGNKVLAKMIGIKCIDFLQFRADKDTKAKMLQGLKKSLIDCDCLMVVRFPKNKSPRVVKLKAIKEIHLKQIQDRQLRLNRL